MKKILLITRPIAPPWDEASKNFAYTLAKTIPTLEFGMLTNGHLANLPKNIRQHSIYTSNSFSYLQKIRLVKNLRKIRKDYNILHYLFTPTKSNAFLVKKFFNYKKDTRSIQTVATVRQDLYSDKEIKKMLFGDLIITYSDYAKTKLNTLGFNNVKRIYPGINLAKYKKTKKDEELMRKKNISKSNFVINFTGEYTRLGAIDLVIDSFIKITKVIHNAKLTLAVRIKNSQDARKKKLVIKKLRHKKLLKNVSFFDDGNYKMEDVYNLCDISLFPVSNMNGKFDVPLAVIEAMACEKTVIISDLIILKELNNGKNSVIIKKGSIEQLTKAILNLYNNPEKRIIIGQEARKFAKEKFDIKKIADIYKQIYNKL